MSRSVFLAYILAATMAAKVVLIATLGKKDWYSLNFMRETVANEL